MWKLLKKNEEGCRKLQDFLEEPAATRPEVSSLDELMAQLPAEESTHMADCLKCREMAEDFLATRKIFKGAASRAEDGGPWFAARVMRAIAAREGELAIAANAWREIPRFASRLAWITAVVLLAGSTWFYEKAMKTPSYPLRGATAQESIFETTPETNQDDILISMAESNP